MNEYEQALQARVELLEMKYPRMTQAGFIAFDRVYRIASFSLTVIGAVTVLRRLVF